jgi:hypothetical protein
MSLRALITAAAGAAFQAAGDVPEAGTLSLNPTGAYDAPTDETTITWAHELPVDVILYGADTKITVDNAGNTPIVDRRRALIQGSQITNGTVDTRAELEVNGVVWKVHGVQPDPVGATIILHLWR